MPISTENSGGALVGKSVAKGTRKVKFLKQTYVHSLGRNSAVGETQEISDSDARFLLAYKYAVPATEVETVEIAEPVVETAEPEVEIAEPVVETAEPEVETPEADESVAGDAKRYFSKRRRG